MQNPKRILIYNVNWLGDVLFSTAAIRALRRSFPDAFIASVIPPRCREMLEDNPHINEILTFDEKSPPAGLFGLIKFIFLLRGRRFDTCIMLHRSLTRCLLVFLAGIPRRVGYNYKKRNFLLTDVVALPDMNNTHRVDFYLNLAKVIGARPENKKLDFYFKEADRVFARGLLREAGVKEGDFCVAVNPGGNWEPKRWPKDNFSSLCDRLVSDFAARVIVVGAGKDSGLVKEITASMKNKPLDLAGKLTLKQLGALFTLMDIVVSADSAPLHIANAVDARAICLFGPTSPEVTGPYLKGDNIIVQKDVGCKIPCYNLKCQENRCMQAIRVDDVLAAVREMRTK